MKMCLRHNYFHQRDNLFIIYFKQGSLFIHAMTAALSQRKSFAEQPASTGTTDKTLCQFYIKPIQSA